MTRPPVVLSEKLIEHLSSEVTTAMNLLTAQRTRNNLTVAFGPYLLLGGYLIAAQQPPNLAVVPRPLLIGGAVLFVAAYAVAGWISATIEGRIWDQCNQWRREIAKLASFRNPSLIEFDRRGLYAIYSGIYAVLGSIFCLVVFILDAFTATGSGGLDP